MWQKISDWSYIILFSCDLNYFENSFFFPLLFTSQKLLILSLQATFKIRIDVPSELTALSNMPIADVKLNENIKTVYFEESPVMSTYLVGVVVGVFDHIEETTADGNAYMAEAHSFTLFLLLFWFK